MARRPFRVSSFIGGIAGRFDFSLTRKPVDQIQKPLPSTSISTDLERSGILESSLRVGDDSTDNRQVGVLEYIQAQVGHQAATRVENDRIMRMVPEFSQARDIMKASLFQPNSLEDPNLPIESRCMSISSAGRARISDALTEYYEKEFHFSDTAPEWTEEVLYYSGAKVLVIIPMVTFKNLLDAPHRKVKSLTSALEDIGSGGVDPKKQGIPVKGDDLSVLRDMVNKTYFSFTDARDTHGISTEDYNAGVAEDITADIVPAIEDFVSKISPSYNRKQPTAEQKTAQRTAVTDTVSKVLASIEVVDNVGLTAFTPVTNEKASKKISEAIDTFYTEAPFLSITPPSEKEEPIAKPILMQPATESVVVLYTPGAPTDHFGYIIPLNEFYQPISMSAYQNGNTPNFQGGGLPGQGTFGNLFQSFGFDALRTQSNMYSLPGGQQVVSAIYQRVIEAHLKRTAANAGFANISLGSSSAVMQCMFTRYLQNRKTRLLFIPKDLVVYYKFKTAADGTGVSKLEDAKYILAMRISLMVIRMMTAFNNAIDRRTLGVTFPEKFKRNPLEYINILKQQYILKSALNVSTKPESIAQQIQEKGINVKATNMPGNQGTFEITNDPNEHQSASIDTDLGQDIKNLTILSTDVPAYALNNMGTQEYARSIATTDLSFARRIRQLQKIMEAAFTEFVQIWAKHDAYVQRIINDVLIKERHNVDANDPGTADVNKDGKFNVYDVISTLRVSLPSPSVAPTKSQFENVEDMLSALDNSLNVLWPDAMAAGDGDLGETVAMIRALIKRDIFTNYLDKIGFSGLDIPASDAADAGDLARARIHLNNIRNELLTIDAVFKKKKQDSDGSGGAGDSFSGGMGSGSDIGGDAGYDGMGAGSDIAGSSGGDDSAGGDIGDIPANGTGMGDVLGGGSAV